MKIRATQIEEVLKQSPFPVYIVSGEEPFQKEEFSRNVRARALRAGFTEQLVYHADNHFDWSLLREAATDLSLFSEKRLIELRLPVENKLPADAESALQFYAKHHSTDNILLLVCHKISKNIERSSWFKTLESSGVWLPVWQIEGRQLISWIVNRVRKSGLNIVQEATTLLAERVEGNLLAAAQEIEKLKLLTNDGSITRQHVVDLVGDSAHFDVFNLSEAVIAGNARHALSIYRTLCSEGVELTVILWVLVRELRILDHLSYLMDRRCNLEEAMEKTSRLQGIPSFVLKRRQHEYLGCVKRLGKKNIQHLLYTASILDSALKTGKQNTVQNPVLTVILKICGIGISGVFTH